MTRIGDAFHNPRIGRFGEADSSQDFQSTFVQPGETMLSQVAERLKLLLDLLQRFNPQIKDPNRLQTGQEIRYPKGPVFPNPVPLENRQAAPGELNRGSLDSRMDSSFGRQQLAGRSACLGEPPAPS